MCNAELPRPRRRLFRTRMRWCRRIERLVEPWPVESYRNEVIDSDLARKYGECLLWEDHVYVLHRDGTTTFRQHSATMLWGAENLSAWEKVVRGYQPSLQRCRIHRLRLRLPGGGWTEPKVQRVVQGRNSEYLHAVPYPLQPGVVLEMDEQTDQFATDRLRPAWWGHFYLVTVAPCRHRRLTLCVARPYTLRMQLHHGVASPTERQVGDYQVYTWEFHDAPGINEGHTPPVCDWAPWIEFSCHPSWKVVGGYLADLLCPNPPDAQLRSISIDRWTRPEQSRREKLEAIHQHVSGRIRYGRPIDQWGNQNPRSPAEVLADLRGDCKDKSGLMVSLLNAVGIPARVAVLATRQQGVASFLPAMRFDHAIVWAQLDGQELWIDPAAGPYRIGDLPRYDQGVEALVLDKVTKSYELKRTPPLLPQNHWCRRRVQARLTELGALEGRVTVEFGGEPAAELRQALTGSPPEQIDQYVQQYFLHEASGSTADHIALKGLDDLREPVQVAFDLKIPTWAKPVRRLLIGDRIWSWIMLVVGPISAPQRRSPLLGIPAGVWTEQLELQLPNGFRAYGLPYAYRSQAQWYSYRCSIRSEGDRIRAVRQVTFRDVLISTEDYPRFRQELSQCALADSRPLIVRRSTK